MESVVKLGAALDIRVVAEGIETEAEREIVQALGCSIGQGYLFAKPMEESGLQRLLDQGLEVDEDGMHGRGHVRGRTEAVMVRLFSNIVRQLSETYCSTIGTESKQLRWNIQIKSSKQLRFLNDSIRNKTISEPASSNNLRLFNLGSLCFPYAAAVCYACVLKLYCSCIE